MTPLLGFEERISTIAEESERLFALSGENLDALVPSCPGWSVRQLIEHVASVLTFYSHQLAAADPNKRSEPPPYDDEKSSEPGEWLHVASEVLLESLGELGADEPCWNWSGFDLDSGWVARRLSLELAVHRYDCELALGEVHPVSAGLAVDGIDERLEVFLRSDLPTAPQATLGGPLCLSSSDVPASWVVEIGGGKLKVREKAGPAAAVLRGSASELYLYSWNRIDPDCLDLTGDPAVVRAWASLPTG